MTTRRGFLGSLGLIVAAPAIVRAESLMKIIMPKPDLTVPATAIWCPEENKVEIVQPDGWKNVAYGNGVFVAISQMGHVATSPDGSIWTVRKPDNPGEYRELVAQAVAQSRARAGLAITNLARLN